MSVFDGMDAIFAETFGDAGVYTPMIGASLTVYPILEEAGETLISSGEVDVVSRTPYADFRESQMFAALEDEVLVARGKTWKLIGGPIPDGRGMVRWMLELQP